MLRRGIKEDAKTTCRSGQCLAIGNIAISCNSVLPVPARVEESVSPVSRSSCGGGTNMKQSTHSQDVMSQHVKVGCQNWHAIASAYYADGGEND